MLQPLKDGLITKYKVITYNGYLQRVLTLSIINEEQVRNT